MTLLTREDLRPLKERAQPPCVSLYLPTYRGGVETQQGPIRLKNLLRSAEEQLAARGDDSRRDDLLGPARELIDDYGFWQRQSDGLALFLAPDLFRDFQLPESFRELALVGDRFHFAPLLPLISGDDRFHVLAVSQKKVRFFQATRHSIREVELRDIPHSLTEAVGQEWEQRTLQFRTGAGGPIPTVARAAAGVGGPVQGGRRGARFHGHGSEVEDSKDEITRFLQLIDDGVVKTTRGQEAPLVVAAVDYELAIYREVSKHPRLAPRGVEGNPDGLSSDEIHRKAWDAVGPVFLEEEKEAMRRIHDLLGSNRVSSELEEVLPAAADGRVDTLVVNVGTHRWGRFDPTQRALEIHEQRQPADEDLIDRAAVETLFHGGKVYPLVDGMPFGQPLAALFRY